MRIVHVEDRFEPQAGYQINEMIKLHVENGNEVIVITSNDSIFSDKENLTKGDQILWEKYKIKVIRLNTILVVSSRYLIKDLFKTIEQVKPDILFMHGIGDFKDLILFKSKRNYKIIRDCHMSWVASKNRFSKIYLKVFKNTIARYINNSGKYDSIYSLGVEETEYIKALGIKNNKIKLLLHGYNKNDMFFSETQRKNIRKDLGYSKDDICISYVGKFDKNKAPHHIFHILNNLEEKYFYENNIKILFIGPKEKTYYEEFLKQLNKFKYKDCCKILEGKKYNELYKYYSAMDIAIWPKECTLSSIHAQVCKCSVLMEKNRSNIERVYNKENLYNCNEFEQASIILKKIVDNKEFLNFNNKKLLNFINEREYTKQINILEEKWKTTLDKEKLITSY